MISGFRYLKPLCLERKLHGFGKLFYVARDYTVEFQLDGATLKYIVPAGMSTDLASIPKVVPRWIAEKMDAIEPSIVHDHMYETRCYLGRKVADDVFLAAMEASRVPWWRRRLMYRAVRTFGKGAWDT